MKTYDARDIRNVGLIGHKSVGKTSLAEAFLWTARATNRFGSTARGTSVLDADAEARAHAMSTQMALAQFPWRHVKINLLDTPGDASFLGETRRALDVVDAAICVVGAQEGAEPTTERVYGWAAERNLARAFFISKMDSENADFDRALASIRSQVCPEASAVQLPIGQGTQFEGVVDLLHERAYVFGPRDDQKPELRPIPPAMTARVAEARSHLVEDIAAADEALMEKFFDGVLTPEDLEAGLAKAIALGVLVPVFLGSGTANRGPSLLLDFFVEELPSPLERGPWSGVLGDAPQVRGPSDPLACFVFQTHVDPHAGRVSWMRVLSGTAQADLSLKNPRRRTQERLGALSSVIGTQLEATEAVPAGDFCATAKLKETHTGDTLSVDGWQKDVAPLPPSLFSRAVRAATPGGEDKLALALGRLLEEDPALTVTRQEQTGETLLSGAGRSHVELAAEKLARKFGVAVHLTIPKIPYLETFGAPVRAVEGKHKKQSGGHGQFAVCVLDFEPAPRGSGFNFENAVVGGTVPRQFVPSVEKGVQRAMARGVITGHPVVDLHVRLRDGKHHAVDSSDMAFQIAASKAFKAAAAQARPIVLEPIMRLDITVPDDAMGDVMGDVNARRGRLLGTESSGKSSVLHALLPLAEVQSYESTLRSMTHGQGTFSMTMSHMEPVPPHIQEKIVRESGFVAAEEEE